MKQRAESKNCHEANGEEHDILMMPRAKSTTTYTWHKTRAYEEHAGRKGRGAVMMIDSVTSEGERDHPYIYKYQCAVCLSMAYSRHRIPLGSYYGTTQARGVRCRPGL